MTAAIVIQLMRFGFLALMWLFLYFIFRLVRADLSGSKPRSVTSAPPRGAPRQPLSRPVNPRGSPRELVVTAGALVGTRVNLGSAPLLIGRADDSTVVLTDDFASSRHARLTRRSDGEWLVEDLGSTNGTYLDRQRVAAPLHVPIGVPIRIGKTVLELRA
ncbi:MAG: FHA domain-containing protein [Antricoccus sp.]